MILFLRGTSATFVMSSKWLHKHDQRVCVCMCVCVSLFVRNLRLRALYSCLLRFAWLATPAPLETPFLKPKAWIPKPKPLNPKP